MVYARKSKIGSEVQEVDLSAATMGEAFGLDPLKKAKEDIETYWLDWESGDVAGAIIRCARAGRELDKVVYISFGNAKEDEELVLKSTTLKDVFVDFRMADSLINRSPSQVAVLK